MIALYDRLIASRSNAMPHPLPRIDRGPVLGPVYAIAEHELCELMNEIERLRRIESTAKALHSMLYTDDAFVLEGGASDAQVKSLIDLRSALGYET